MRVRNRKSKMACGEYTVPPPHQGNEICNCTKLIQIKAPSEVFKKDHIHTHHPQIKLNKINSN